MKTIHQLGSKNDDQGVDHKKKKTEREDRNGNGKNRQNGLYDCIQKGKSNCYQ